MEQFVALDVSQKLTHIAVADAQGRKIWRGKCETTALALIAIIREKVPDAVKVGLESGPLSTWLWHELKHAGLPVVCLDARHAHGALSVNLNKTDANDADGMTDLLRTGWYKEVCVKSLDSHRLKSTLIARAKMVEMRTDVMNTIRVMLKTFGIVLSASEAKGFDAKVKQSIAREPSCQLLIEPLIVVLESLKEEIRALDQVIMARAKADPVCRNLMTIPGIGPVTSLAFMTAIDDPRRFKRSASVGAFFGLTPRRYQSGEVNVNRGISKCGNGMTRSYLFEAAQILLTRVQKWSTLKAWGVRLAKRSGMKKAIVAVARKLSVIMHQMWLTGEAFRWSAPEVAAA